MGGVADPLDALDTCWTGSADASTAVRTALFSFTLGLARFHANAPHTSLLFAADSAGAAASVWAALGVPAQWLAAAETSAIGVSAGPLNCCCNTCRSATGAICFGAGKQRSKLDFGPGLGVGVTIGGALWSGLRATLHAFECIGAGGFPRVAVGEGLEAGTKEALLDAPVPLAVFALGCDAVAHQGVTLLGFWSCREVATGQAGHFLSWGVALVHAGDHILTGCEVRGQVRWSTDVGSQGVQPGNALPPRFAPGVRAANGGTQTFIGKGEADGAGAIRRGRTRLSRSGFALSALALFLVTALAAESAAAVGSALFSGAIGGACAGIHAHSSLANEVRSTNSTQPAAAVVTALFSGATGGTDAT